MKLVSHLWQFKANLGGSGDVDDGILGRRQERQHGALQVSCKRQLH